MGVALYNTENKSLKFIPKLLGNSKGDLISFWKNKRKVGFLVMGGIFVAVGASLFIYSRVLKSRREKRNQ